MWVDYENHRTLTTMAEVVRLKLKVRRCQNEDCTRYHRPYRPEAEGQWALPGHEFGLDIIAIIGNWRYRNYRTVGELHEQLQEQGVAVSKRTVTNRLDRYDELVSISLQESEQLRKLLREQGQVILAIDGLQPDMGHEVLWVIRAFWSKRTKLYAKVGLKRPFSNAPVRNIISAIIGLMLRTALLEGGIPLKIARLTAIFGTI